MISWHLAVVWIRCVCTPPLTADAFARLQSSSSVSQPESKCIYLMQRTHSLCTIYYCLCCAYLVTSEDENRILLTKNMNSHVWYAHFPNLCHFNVSSSHFCFLLLTDLIIACILFLYTVISFFLFIKDMWKEQSALISGEGTMYVVQGRNGS